MGFPSIPYPPAGTGYWGPVTSTLNWCEEDYYASRYFAEIVNALTNCMFFWLGAKGIRSCMKNEHDSVFIVAFLGYLVVGIGSFCFHSTLKYPMQLVDELSMIYTTCLMCYATYSYKKSFRFRLNLGVFLVSLSIFITAYYHYLQNPIFHQNAFAILTILVVTRSMYVMETTLRPSRRKSTEEDRLARMNAGLEVVSKEQQQFENARDMEILKTMWTMTGYGLFSFVGGFALWNLDNQLCSNLQGWRRYIGLPWGIFLEGHGWWHLMTGVGAYMYILWGIWIRHCQNGLQDDYTLKWARFYNIPDLVRIWDDSPPTPKIMLVDEDPMKATVDISTKRTTD